MALPGVTVKGGLATGGAFRTGAGALVSVQIEMAQFDAVLQRFVERFQVDVAEIVEAEAFELEGAIKDRTPVKTGRLRSSFHTVVYGRASHYEYSAGGKSFDGTLSVAPAGPYEAIVGTNVEYAQHIEAGHSRKAPAGMVRVSVAERRGFLERRLGELAS